MEVERRQSLQGNNSAEMSGFSKTTGGARKHMDADGGGLLSESDFFTQFLCI